MWYLFTSILADNNGTETKVGGDMVRGSNNSKRNVCAMATAKITSHDSATAAEIMLEKGIFSSSMAAHNDNSASYYMAAQNSDRNNFIAFIFKFLDWTEPQTSVRHGTSP